MKEKKEHLQVKSLTSCDGSCVEQALVFPKSFLYEIRETSSSPGSIAL
jgi:hypothetical protein